MKLRSRLLTILLISIGILLLAFILTRTDPLQKAGPISAAMVEPYEPLGTGGSPIGSSFPISYNLGVRAIRPAVAFNSQRHEYLTVWWNDRAGYDDIYGRRITTDGTLLPWFAIVWGPYVRTQPDVAYNSQDDEYFVVYTEDWDIGGARLPATGGAASYLFGYTTDGWNSTIYNDLPSIAYNSAQSAYLLTFRFVNENWNGKFGSRISIVGILPDGSGMISGVLNVDGFSTSTTPGYPDVAYNPTQDEFLVVWQRKDGTDWDIYGQRARYEASSQTIQTINGIFPIINTSDQQYGAAVASLPRGNSGEYLVVYSSESGGDWKISGQRVTGLGTLIGDTIDIALGLGVKENVDVAASSKGGRYLVAWTHAHSTIRERAVSADGQLLGDEIEIGSPLAMADEPAVVGGPLSDFLVAYQDVPPDKGDYDIFGQLWGIRVYLPLVVRGS